MARPWHPCRLPSCRKDFGWGEGTEWIAGSCPAMTGNGKDWGEKRSEVRVAFFWRATQSSTTRKAPIETLSPSTHPPSCHGSPMASMPLVLLSQGLRVGRGNGMDCRVEPCNDGEWNGLWRQKQRSACWVLLARDSVFDTTQGPVEAFSPRHTLGHAMARPWHPRRLPSCRKGFWWGEETEWIAGSSPAMTGNGKGWGEKRSEVRVAFSWRATQSSTTRKAPIETFRPSTHPPSCHGSTMASMPLVHLSQRLRVGRGNGMDCRVSPAMTGNGNGCGDKSNVVRVGFFWRATQSSTTRKAPIETFNPLTHPPSCHGSTMASTPLAILSQRLLVGRGNGMDCRVEPCNDKGRCVMTEGDV